MTLSKTFNTIQEDLEHSRNPHQPETLDCGHQISAHSDYTTGYATDTKGKKICYECCAKADRAQMKEHGKIWLYLSEYNTPQGKYLTNYKVTNWPGSLVFNIHRIKTGRHNIARVRYDVWFIGPDRHWWHGVQYGDNTQICRCERTKEKLV